MKLLHTLTKCGFLLAALLLFGNAALAQRTVKGKVTDSESGEALIGATVVVVGSTRGATTDIDGAYTVEVPAGATQLRFAYTGYAEEVVDLGASNVVDIALKPGTVLDEVVVVGYGTLKAKEVTSSIATVKAEDFNRGNVTSPAQLIQGKVAGVTIARPGSDPNGEFAIRLRGLSSISSGTSPLIVVDGVPGVNLNLVDPNDIASIDVLKDGSSAAIYGTRASSGVILVTTKKGQSGVTRAEYNGFVAFDQIARRYETLNAADFTRLGGVDLSPGEDIDTDWMDEITQTGTSNVHNLSISGGAGRGSFRASFNYRDVAGILRTTGLTQYNGSLSFTQKVLNDRLSIDGNLFLTSRESEFGFSEAFRYAVVNNPTAGVRSDDAEFTRFGGYVEKDLFDYFNPVAMIEQNFNRGKVNRMLGNVRLTYDLMSNWNVALNLSQERTSDNYGQFYSKQSKFRGFGRNGAGVRGVNNNITNLLELQSEYTINFGSNSNLRLLGGYSYQDFQYDGVRVDAGNILTNVLENNNLFAFQELQRGLANVSSYRGENTLIAFFGRAQINIDDTWFGQVGIRREGSTRFGPNNRWGTFPWVSAGVNLEKLVDIPAVDQLKLRVGYGITGNQPNQNGLSILQFAPGASFYYNGNYVPSYGPSQNANPDLKWEQKGEFDAGVDFALLDYKITGSLDYYNRTTNDLLLFFPVPVPPNLAPNTWQNLASFTTNGFEAAVNFNNLVNKENFKWSPGLIFNTYSIKLTDLGRQDTVRSANVGAPGQNDVFYTILYNGIQLGTLWGPVRESVNTDGSIAYKDINGDGKVERESFADQTVIGNGVPDFELSINNNFTFGNFDLNFLLRGVFGHDLANEYRIFYENLDPTAATWNKVRTDFFNENLKAQNRFDDTHVEKATFLRLDNATLGYNFNLGSGSWFNKARIYLSGQNLFTITNYSGVDPEVRLADTGSSDNGGGAFGNDPLAIGIDRRTNYFLARTISIGVNFGF
jgi:TonB-linked SusC/RagA family outer membrane protein